MSQEISGILKINNDAHQTTISLDGNSSDIVAGGEGSGGEVILRNESGTELARLDGQTGELKLRDQHGNVIVNISGPDGTITISDSNGKPKMRLTGLQGNIFCGGNGVDGDVVLFKNNGDNTTATQASIFMDAQRGAYYGGSNGVAGKIFLQPATSTANNDINQAHIQLDAEHNRLAFKVLGKDRVRIEGGGANMYLGGNGADGDIVVFRKTGDNQTLSHAVLHFDGDGGNLWIGGNGADGDIALFPSGANNINDLHQATIHLNGQNGHIRFANADFAEDFDILESQFDTIEPGTVMVLDDHGKLCSSNKPYDKRVTGIVSGAGSHKPGIIMDNQPNISHRMPIALMGKTYCKVDASYGPVESGDLLTTSPTIGHAMKAQDPMKAFGSVLGKALTSLKEGKGLIPVLVTLQ